MVTVVGTAVALIGAGALSAWAAGETVVIALPEPDTLSTWLTVLAGAILAARWFTGE